jgi:hypothetical protein
MHRPLQLIRKDQQRSNLPRRTSEPREARDTTVELTAHRRAEVPAQRSRDGGIGADLVDDRERAKRARQYDHAAVDGMGGAEIDSRRARRSG